MNSLTERFSRVRGELPTLLLRIGIGAFLFVGAFEVITSEASLKACAEVWRNVGIAAPQMVAIGSVTAQLTCGIFLLFGFLTRFFGSLQAMNGAMLAGVASPPVDLASALLSMLILALPIYFATHGGGRFSLDNGKRRLALLGTASERGIAEGSASRMTGMEGADRTHVDREAVSSEAETPHCVKKAGRRPPGLY